MKQIIPPNLKQGDTIGIVATARWISPEGLEPALSVIRGWGFKVKCGKYLHKQVFQLAGSEEERAEDLQSMLDDDSVKAIIMARGGYGTVRIIDKIDFSRFIQDPKWICGYSDITVLHNVLNHRGIATLHSTMPISFGENSTEVLESLRLALMGRTPAIRFESAWNLNLPKNPIQIKGKLVGGNLSVICSLLGSIPIDNSEDKVLFIEDIDEHLYHIDRMLMALKRSGSFYGLKAILVGGMTGMKDNTKEFGFGADKPWGKSVELMFSEIAGVVDIPVIAGVPSGHQSDNRTLRLGAEVLISGTDKNFELSF